MFRLDPRQWAALTSGFLVHLSIGQIYAFSVLIEPLQALGTSDGQQWTSGTLTLIYGSSFAMLGVIANTFGRFVSRRRLEHLIVLLLVIYPASFVVAALAVHWRSLPLLAVALSGIGGLALGTAYISPISTLVRHFPKMSGLATGASLAGFGGGGILAAPLTAAMLDGFRFDGTFGLRTTFLFLALMYSCVLCFAWQLARGLPDPPGRDATSIAGKRRLSTSVLVREERLILWLRLAFGMSVLATIGILGQSGYMFRRLFPHVTLQEGAMFVSMLAVANMGGRLLFAFLADRFTPARIYALVTLWCTLALLGLAYSTVRGEERAFVAMFGMVILCYGGLFSVLPAYAKQAFSSTDVSYYHGRILLAWSPAALLSPVLIGTVLTHGSTLASSHAVLYTVLAGCTSSGFLWSAYLLRHVQSGRMRHREALQGVPDASGF